MKSKVSSVYNFEERDRLIWENFNDLIIVVEPIEDFRIEYINEDVFKHILGYTDKDLLGKSFLKYIHSDDLIKYKDLYTKYAFDDQVREVKIAAKNGDYVWFEFRIKTFKNSRNQQRLFIILREISRLKDLESKLKESEKRFKKVTNLVPEINFWDKFTPKKFDKVLNRTRELLRQNEAIFRTAIESLPFDFFMINKDSYYIAQNTTCKENWGDIIGKRSEDIANNKDTLAVWQKNNARAFSGETVTGEVKFKMNGKIRYFYNIIKPVYIEDKIEYILGVNIDITDLKYTERKLQKSEDRYRLIYENANDLIKVLNNRFEYEDLNEISHYRILGYSKEDLLKKNPLSLLHPEDRKQTIISLSKILRKGKGSYQTRFKHKNGSYKWLEISARNFIDDAGNNKIITIGRDITDRKVAERRIIESEEKYRELAELLPDIIYEGDLNLNLTYVNSVAFKKFGYTPEDLDSGLKITDFLDSKYKEKAMSQIKLLLQGAPTKPEQYLLRKKDGNTFYARIHSRPILKNNKVIGIRGTITDITDIILAKQELKESEEKFRTIAEQSFMGIIILQDGIFKYFNEQARKLNGYSLEEIKNWEPYEFIKLIHLDDREFVMEQARKKEAGKKDVIHQHKYKLIRKDGEIRWLENFSKTINYRGKPADLIMSIDITENIKAEQKLKESEEKYRHLYENSPNAILLINMKGNILDCNLISEKLSGFKRNELIGNNVLDLSFIPEKYIPLILEDFKTLLKGESLNSREIQLYNREGKLSWVSYQASILNYQNEKLIQLIIQVINERKKSEHQLKESEEKFRTITEQSLLGICIIQDFKVKYVNQQIADIYGYSLAEIYNWKPKEFIKVIHQDYRKIIVDQISKKQQGSQDIIKRYIAKAIRKNGDIIWIENYSSPIIYQGRPADLLTQINITEKKEAERKLKESEARYHELFETSPDGVILTDIKGNILECNSALERIFGYSIEEFIGRNFMELEIYHKNALEVLLEGYNDLLGNYSISDIEFPIKRKDNNIGWVQINSTLIHMKGEKFILTVIHNITSQKQAEEALKRNEEKYRDLLETSSLGVIEIDVKSRKMTYINPKLLDIIGYTRTELLDEKFRNDLIQEKDLSKMLMTNEEAELEFRIIDKQGKEKWLSGKRVPHFNDKGEITSVSVWLDDITEKKVYEELIYELNINFLNFTADIRNNIELLLNTGLKLLNGDIMLYVQKIKLDSQIRYQVITSENEIYTFEEKDFFEKLFLNELFYEEHDFPQTFLNIHMRKYAEIDPFIKNSKIKGCFGKVIKSHTGSASAVGVFYKENPIITGQEKLVMFLICDAIEIEQRRWQVQRDLEQQNITLNKINKLKTELFSRTSHELKTPLISIKGFTELLLTLHHSKFDPEVISILEEIKEGSKRLEKIINLLLESTKLEAGHLELNPSEEDLTFLIKFCVKELRGLASLRKQTISLDLHDILNTKFDKERIYEVISNLIVNAIKYTPPGGHIEIKSEINNSEYIISIQDNGIGFTEEEKGQAFKQFGKIERFGQGWDVATEGSGLGLYITKKLIELHGGKIWLESKGRNKGSTFYFSIPKK